MVSIHKAVGVMACSFLLCLGLSTAAQAENAPASSDHMKADAQSDVDKKMNDKMGSTRSEGTKMVKGELLRIEDGNYFVKGKDGKEVRMHTDKTTQMIGQIKKGDSIEAKVNDQDHALLIRQTQ